MALKVRENVLFKSSYCTGSLYKKDELLICDGRLREQAMISVNSNDDNTNTSVSEERFASI